MNDKTLNIKLPEKLYNSIKKEAENKNISIAALVRMVLTEYLEQKK